MNWGSDPTGSGITLLCNSSGAGEGKGCLLPAAARLRCFGNITIKVDQREGYGQYCLPLWWKDFAKPKREITEEKVIAKMLQRWYFNKTIDEITSDIFFSLKCSEAVVEVIKENMNKLRCVFFFWLTLMAFKRVCVHNPYLQPLKISNSLLCDKSDKIYHAQTLYTPAASLSTIAFCVKCYEEECSTYLNCPFQVLPILMPFGCPK